MTQSVAVRSASGWAKAGKCIGRLRRTRWMPAPVKNDITQRSSVKR